MDSWLRSMIFKFFGMITVRADTVGISTKAPAKAVGAVLTNCVQSVVAR